MNILNKYIVLLCLVCLGLTGELFAQFSSGGTPLSILQRLPSRSVPTVTMAPPSNDILIAQADAAYENAMSKGDLIPFQVAEPLPVNLNLKNSGVWETLADGSRLWRLRIESKNATALYFVFDRWWIPKYAELFIYSDDRSDIRGAFTSFNNWIDTTNMTAPIPGNAVTLEYIVHPEAEHEGELSISTVLHGFRPGFNPLDAFGDSGPCNININCPEGNNWQNEKRSVALAYMPSGGTCSGALIANTAQNFIPYFLTADHCEPTSGTNWAIVFNYESPNCSNINGSQSQTITNATQIARLDVSDFMLLQLSVQPPVSWSPYYCGWDRTGSAPQTVTSVHHPRADIKKISIENDPAYSTDWNGQFAGHRWGVHWEAGVSEPGSSGSPWFDQNHRIVAQLQGGFSECSQNPGERGPDKGGKFSTSWEHGALPEQRLREWLDPLNSGEVAINGAFAAAPPNDECANAYVIGGFPYTFSGTTSNADAEFLNCSGATSPMVWYRLPAQSCSTSVTVTTCGSSFDTQLMVFSGPCDGGFLFVGCNDDDPAACTNPRLSRIQFWAVPGASYDIAVTGFGAEFGNYTINVTGQPVTPYQDLCPGETVHYLGVPENRFGSTTCATNQNFGTCAVDGGSPDVIYYIYSHCSQRVIIDGCGSTFDTIYEVWRDDPPYGCGTNQTFLACGDDRSIVPCFQNPQSSEIIMDFVEGEWYFLIINGYNGAAGDYNVWIRPYITNDECPGKVIPTLPFLEFGSTLCGPTDNYSGSCVGSFSNDLVYSYTPATCHTCRVSLCFLSNFDTGLYVREGNCLNGPEVACDDNFCGDQSQVTFPVYAGRTYYIFVDGNLSENGDFGMTVINEGAVLLPADECATAATVTALPFVETASTVCTDGDYVICNNAASTPDAIYPLLLDQCANVTATLCGSLFDTKIEVRTDGGCPGTTVVTCNDDQFCNNAFSLQSTVAFTAQAGVEYYIIISGASGATGQYTLNLTGTPCAPALDAPQELTILPIAGTNDIILHWRSVEGAASYSVYNSDSDVLPCNDPSFLSFIPVDTFLIHEDILSDPGLKYYYCVEANPPDPVSLRATDGLTKEDAVRASQ